MRHQVACILLAAGAVSVHADPEEARVRALVDGYRSEESRSAWEASFEGGETIAEGELIAEYGWDSWWKRSHALARFVPRADSVEIQWIVLNSIPPDGPCRARGRTGDRA